ncbi:glutamate receptor-like [Haliotis asinina]|uniref:glutamate receptor-like n=1 Tax=Haliotis asinina TaxID=109174 RepID=UPI00353253D1
MQRRCQITAIVINYQTSSRHIVSETSLRKVICTMRTKLILIYTYSYVWTLDILLTTEGYAKCQRPVVCHRNDSVGDQLNVTNWLISAGDLFAASKTVRWVGEDMMVLTSLSPCQCDFTPSTHRNDIPFSLCSVVCSTLLSSHTMNVQSVLKVTNTRQTNFNTLVRPHSIHDLTKGITSIVNHVKWKTFVVTTSSYDVLTALSGGILAPIKLLMYMIDDPNNPLEDIDLESFYQMLPKEDLNFLVMCPSDCILKLLKQVGRMESNMTMTESAGSSKWLVIPSSGSVMDIAHSREALKTEGVVFLEFMPCSKYYAPLVNNSLLLSYLQSFAQERSKVTEQDAEQLQKPPTARHSVVQAELQVLSKSHTETKIETVGYIGRDNSVEVKHPLYHVSRYGFHNRMLIVGTLEWAPFVIKRMENGSVKFDGLCIQLLQELAKQLNFSYRLMEPKDKEWGRVLNGSWTGLVKLLSNEEADMVVAPMSMTDSRATVIDFTVPYFYANSALILSKQNPNSSKWMTLLSPLRYEVLVCILVSLIFSTVFLFLLEEVAPVFSLTNNRPADLLTRYRDIFWYHFGALVANGGAYLPKTGSGRTVLICWWLFAVIMAATYSGNLIAFLTDGREKTPFSSLAEMVQQDTYNWGFAGGTSVDTLFQDSNISVYRKIWQRVEEMTARDPDWLSPDGNEHLRRAVEKQYVYIAEESTLEMWDDPRRCSLQMLNENFRSMQLAVGLPQNSELVHVFSHLILRIIESGLLDLWWNRLKPKHRCESPSRNAKRVDLSALQSAFYGAGVGVAMALVVLLCEMRNNRRCKQDQKSNSESIDEDSMRSDALSQVVRT